MWRALIFAGVFVWATQAEEADPLDEELEFYFAEIEEPFQPVTRFSYLLEDPLADDPDLVLRAYWPKVEVLTGGWNPPAVKRVKWSRYGPSTRPVQVAS